MTRIRLAAGFALGLASTPLVSARSPEPAAPAAVNSWQQGASYSGSVSCRECHEKFYALWSQSNHGLAMQPYSPALAGKIAPLELPITIGEKRYSLVKSADAACVVEETQGQRTELPIAHAMGGKNIYYFLTPYRGGRLQVVPIAYDVKRATWIDTTASMVRHGLEGGDEALPWTDPMLTFNTACYNCHVSQLSNQYDLKSDSYTTTWGEPGINCEACHGPGAEHVKVCKAAPEGYEPKDMKILSWKALSGEQQDHACLVCHAKMSPVTGGMPPGENFFDHYDLVTLENQDYYPDGRDLGENYTFTSWRASPCAKSGMLNCLHCHTSSGRYRFKQEQQNHACLPCHALRVRNAPAHTHHKAGGEGNLCVSCHMPMTEFGRMARSDHSMRPPAPAATIAFGSPNACTLCHTGKSAQWADDLVRKWRTRDYQAPILERGRLIQAARKRDWTQLDTMLGYLERKDRDEVVATSLIRLLLACPDAAIFPHVERLALQDGSPLVRSAAAAALQGSPRRESLQALVAATKDTRRLVRVRAAASLGGVPPEMFDAEGREAVAAATAELFASYTNRLDQWGSHYNQGNFYQTRNRDQEAIAAYEQAHALRPDVIMPLVNLSQAYARQGLTAQAESALRKALVIEPKNAAVNFNLGLLMGERGALKEAEALLLTATRTDPAMTIAFFNLGIVQRQLGRADALLPLRRAVALEPGNPRMVQGLASFLLQDRDTVGALAVLDAHLAKHPGSIPVLQMACQLLGQRGDRVGMRKRMQAALDHGELDPQVRFSLEQQLK